MIEKIRLIQRSDEVKRISNALFYLTLIIEILVVIVDKSNYTNPIEGRIFQITFCLFLLKVILTEYDFKEYTCIFLFGLFGLFIDQMSGRNEIIRFVIFIAECKDIDMKKAMKLTLYLTAAGCMVIMLLSVFGIYGDITVIKELPGEYTGQLTEELYVFGMGNANALHCMFFVLCLLGMYLYADRMKWWGYLAIFIANILLYLDTRSKTGAAITAVSVIAMAVVSYVYNISYGFSCKNYDKPQYSKLQGGGKRILRFFVAFCGALNITYVILSVYLASVAWKIDRYKWSIFDGLGNRKSARRLMRLDDMLTGRISSITEWDSWDGAIQSWRWFPAPNHDKYFDLGFVRLFYWYGIIPTIIILSVLAILFIYLYKNKKYTEIVFLTLISLYTLVEAHFVSVYIARNYVLFVLGMCWVDMLEGIFPKYYKCKE